MDESWWRLKEIFIGKITAFTGDRRPDDVLNIILSFSCTYKKKTKNLKGALWNLGVVAGRLSMFADSISEQIVA